MMGFVWLGISILTLLFALYNLFKLIIFIKKNEKEFIWYLVSFVLSIFIGLFGFYTYFMLNGRNVSQTVNYVVLMYFLSAVFVLFVIRRSHKMISGLNKKQKELLDSNLKLEYETVQKTKELESKVFELEKTRSAMLNILEDVNDQKKDIEGSEKELAGLNKRLEKQNKELLALDKQKDQFTSITAHELKTPLASIKGFVQLLQNKKVFEDHEKREKYMGIIVQDTNRLAKLVTDILDVSRMELGTLKFYFSDINVKDTIENVKKEMGSIIHAKKIKDTYRVDKEVPKTIWADSDRLAQVLTNLINNAVHYTDENGKIDVDVTKKGKTIIFSVSDTGAGIPKQQQKKDI